MTFFCIPQVPSDNVPRKGCLTADGKGRGVTRTFTVIGTFYCTPQAPSDNVPRKGCLTVDGKGRGVARTFEGRVRQILGVLHQGAGGQERVVVLQCRAVTHRKHRTLSYRYTYVRYIHTHYTSSFTLHVVIPANHTRLNATRITL